MRAGGTAGGKDIQVNDTREQGQTEYPPAIDLRDVGEVEGTVDGFDQAPTKFAPNAVIVRIRDSSGAVGSLWLTSTVLKSQFARLKPKVGERIHATYLGMREGAGGSYHNYKVTAPDRPPFEPDWDQLGGEEDGDFLDA
jgi:hypothetical protein